MPRKLALATGNQHKIQELATMLAPLGWEVLSPKDLGILNFNPEETGLTFESNAHIKSQALFQMTGIPSLADDSGLVVDALNGEPGIYSARYGGASLDDRGRAELVLSKMKDQNTRTARFICVLSLCLPGELKSFEGRVEGEIGEIYQPGNGFGYDPIFFYPPKNCYFSDLKSEEKNEVSHRSIAMNKLLGFIRQQERT